MIFDVQIRDSFVTLKNDIASEIQSHQPEHPLNGLIGRSIDFMDYDNIRMNYRKQKTVLVAGKLKEYLAELYDELSDIMDVEREWARMNSLPNATYDGIDNSAYVHTGAVIWILDQIKKTRKAGELVGLLPDRRYTEDMYMEMPDMGLITGIHWDTIRQIHKEMMEDTLEKRKQELLAANYHPRLLAVDEFAIHKGHTYATCVMDLESGEVLWVGKGRSKADFARFFDEIEPSFLTGVMAIAMDMNASYYLLIQEKLPQAKIVYW